MELTSIRTSALWKQTRRLLRPLPDAGDGQLWGVAVGAVPVAVDAGARSCGAA